MLGLLLLARHDDWTNVVITFLVVLAVTTIAKMIEGFVRDLLEPF